MTLYEAGKELRQEFAVECGTSDHDWYPDMRLVKERMLRRNAEARVEGLEAQVKHLQIELNRRP